MVKRFVDKYALSKTVEIAQRCKEFRALATEPTLMEEVLPVDASCEDIEADPELRFLQVCARCRLRRGGAHQWTCALSPQRLVDRRLAEGARPYELPSGDGEEEDGRGMGIGAKEEDAGPGLRFEAYEDPKASQRCASARAW